MHIRKAISTDLPAIVAIYNQAILTRTCTGELEPFEVEGKRKWFNDHHPDQFPIFVAEVDNRVVAWISLSPYRPGRQAFRYTAEVSYYIDKSFHGQGIGTTLLKFVINECPRYKIKTLIAIILEPNLPSVNLVKKFNFAQWGMIPGVADFFGTEYAHLYYGLRVENANRETAQF